MSMRYLLAFLLTALPAAADLTIVSPGFTPSQVDPEGALIEPWGKVRLCLHEPAGAKPPVQRYTESAVPEVDTVTRAGDITLSQSAYRAPIFPSGVDLIIAGLQNHGKEAAQAGLTLEVPENMLVGRRLGTVDGRAVLALPKEVEPIRKERAWGCTGGVTPLPGWASPSVPCDPAFKNIRAGMGGVPIVYAFAVPKGEKRTLALGFCESYHPKAGIRPLLVEVEGAEAQEIDPVAKWGQHVPGCVLFNGADADGDGKITASVRPGPKAQDVNPILNAVWVFPAGFGVDEAALIQGGLNAQAERFVDVGGEGDQLLYEPGSLRYSLTVEPNKKVVLLFLVAGPDTQAVPNPETMSWTAESLCQAALDVAKGWE